MITSMFGLDDIEIAYRRGAGKKVWFVGVKTTLLWGLALAIRDVQR